MPGALLIALSKVTDAVLHSRDWTYEYRSAGAIALVAFAMIAVVAIWGAIGAARTARRAEDYGEGIIRVYAGVSVVMAITLATAGQYGFSTWKYLAWAAEMARDDGKHIEIQVDKASARMVVSGEFYIGTARRVRDALAEAPWVRLIEFDSPGGLAREGLALAALLDESQVDTLVLGHCHSACTLAFVVGRRRYMGKEARIGLHSAGTPSGRPARHIDVPAIRIMNQHGVATWLTDALWETPISDLLVLGPNTLIASGMVTGMWQGEK